MKHVALNQDVFIVDGAKRSAIYDLCRQKLYSISRECRDSIFQMIETPHYSDAPLFNHRLFCSLMKENIIIESEKLTPPIGIHSVKTVIPPSFAWVEVTQQCNMACPFCYEKSDASSRKKMNFADFKIAINHLIEANIKRIQLIGGEPLLLNDDLKDMILYSRKSFDFVEVFSNGTLIDREWCKFFNEHELCIALSIHSYLPEQHNKLVNLAGAHESITTAVNLLNEHRVKYRIATIRNKNCRIGKPGANIAYTLRPKNPKVVGRAQIRQYDYQMFARKAITKATFSKPITKRVVGIAIAGFRCFLKNLYISTDLTVYPCVMERRFNYGNLKEQRLKNLLRDRRRFLSKEDVDGCRDCEYRYACFDCRPDANGADFDQKPWYCSYNPAEGTWKNLQTMFDETRN